MASLAENSQTKLDPSLFTQAYFILEPDTPVQMYATDAEAAIGRFPDQWKATAWTAAEKDAYVAAQEAPVIPLKGGSDTGSDTADTADTGSKS